MRPYRNRGPRIEVREDVSLAGEPNRWTVVQLYPRHGWSVIFRGTFDECVEQRATWIADWFPEVMR